MDEIKTIKLEPNDADDSFLGKIEHLFIPAAVSGNDNNSEITPHPQTNSDEQDFLDEIPSLESMIQASSVVFPPLPEFISNDINLTKKKADKFFVTKHPFSNPHICSICHKKDKADYMAFQEFGISYICGQACLSSFMRNRGHSILFWRPNCNLEEKMNCTFEHSKKCFMCYNLITNSTNTASLSWRNVDFCNENCLVKYLDTNCRRCTRKIAFEIYGKFSIRWRIVIFQFCSEKCMEFHRKTNNSCTYCHTNFSKALFVAVNSDKQEFCSHLCAERLERLLIPKPPETDVKCGLCGARTVANIQLHYQKSPRISLVFFCSEKCFVGFLFLNDIKAGKCCMCLKYFPSNILEQNSLILELTGYNFCSEGCKNVFIDSKKLILTCDWCQENKTNFEMITTCINSTVVYFCSFMCFILYKNNDLQNPSMKWCNHCKKVMPMAAYFVPMSDLSVKSFCSLSCASFFKKHDKWSLNVTRGDAFPRAEPQRNLSWTSPAHSTTAPSPPPLSILNSNNSSQPIRTIIKHHVVLRPSPVPPQRNVATMCKVRCSDKNVGTEEVQVTSRSTQTDAPQNAAILPIPFPIYVPCPLPAYVAPMPYALPLAIPFPIPIFLAIPRNTMRGVLKELAKIRNRTPENELEADLVTLAGVAAEGTANSGELNNSSDEEPEPIQDPIDFSRVIVDESLQLVLSNLNQNDANLLNASSEIARISTGNQHQLSQIPSEAQENQSNSLKSAYGANAWKQWTVQNNLGQFGLLDLSTAELDLGLARFVKEIRKPNGTEYAPDTVFYLCISIQQYLKQNGRSYSIFYDTLFKNFINTIDDVVSKFMVLQKQAHTVVTRVEENHLWESGQLGSHSPQALIYTIMYFNTKYFKLSSVEEHKVVSFVNVVKQCKRKTRNDPHENRAILRFYSPKEIIQKCGKKYMYEIKSNHKDESRCPIKLFELYLAKCPDHMKGRNDLFYLQPERSCLPDSPVWYSSSSLGTEEMSRYFNRIRLSKEINMALLLGED